MYGHFWSLVVKMGFLTSFESVASENLPPKFKGDVSKNSSCMQLLYQIREEEKPSHPEPCNLKPTRQQQIPALGQSIRI